MNKSQLTGLSVVLGGVLLTALNCGAGAQTTRTLPESVSATSSPAALEGPSNRIARPLAPPGAPGTSGGYGGTGGGSYGSTTGGYGGVGGGTGGGGGILTLGDIPMINSRSGTRRDVVPSLVIDFTTN